MATSSFKSNSKRSNLYGSVETSPKGNPINTKPNPNPQKQRLRRSLSVNALNRSQIDDISSEFLNKRDNPLYWANGGSPPAADAETSVTILGTGSSGGTLESRVSQRSRSVNRNSDLGRRSKKEEIVIGRRRRSLSRVNDNGAGAGAVRRGRPVSRVKLPSESESEQESVISTRYRGRSSSIRPSCATEKVTVSGGKAYDTQDRRSSHASRHPSLDSQVLNCEDGVSTSSLSEAEEKTIKAVYEQIKSFQDDNLRDDTASSEIYETVRSEVRRAIADIQYGLQHVIGRNNNGPVVSTNVTDIHPDLVKPEAVKLVLDIRREYAKKLEEAQERTRKLRSDLAIEEHRKQELSKILKETLPEPKASVAQTHRHRLGRKSSSERKKMSKRLTEEAMSYFDECVSISTFDSSDFSAAEDSTGNSIDTMLTTGASTSTPQGNLTISASSLNNKCEQVIPGHPESGSSCVTDHVLENTDNTERERKFRFSFGHKPTESSDIRSYIKTFEKDGFASKKVTTNYTIDAYSQLDVGESLLFDKVFLKNRLESGSLHLCGGVFVPFLPITHLI